ncbi:cytochrome-c oxidase [Paragemmobacter straminiformis]|uniref:Cytochrome-c oxidase n=1 Tax=Paragemmobacter straminiformis TaxID=2045119 RepID=A0A842IC13_9RHOB|nr:cytochrome-c oxidase [Gemmobacter straminiformis]MBC2837161.1 cytochrome-c oxidase [Gemmobacter straminiformis]
MNISRNFIVIGSLYLLVGIILGSYMGGSGDHSLAPVHAHINLLGFTLMTLFGVAYRVIPALAGGTLAKAHFWLHQIGALVLLVGLFLLMSGMVGEGIGIIFPIAEVTVLLGVACWAINVFKNA